MRRLLALTWILLGGCNLYFTGDDDCSTYGAPAAPEELRDPQTGVCQPIGGGGGGCGNTCGPCAEPALGGALPDWGSCVSACDALSEPTCLGTAGCRAAYLESTDRATPAFLGCWAVAQSGPRDDGTCAGLDAQGCSLHDNCSAFYATNLEPLPDNTTGMHFTGCAAEQTDPCATIDCSPGSHCEQQCQPCGDGSAPACDPTCQAMCVPDQGCAETTCPTGSECVQTCTGGGGGPSDCGTCTTTCVPSGTCGGLGSEAACKARSDCTEIYQGSDCTCDANGACTCQVLTYERCESL